jgi:hypothetical protein
MNVAVRTRVATGAAAGTLWRWLYFLLDSWRRITLKQILVVNLIALLISGWDVLTWLRMSLQASWQARAWIFCDNAMIAMGMLLVVAIADRVVPRRWPWWMPYAVGALFGGLLVNLLTTWFFQYMIPLPTIMDAYAKPGNLHRMRTLVEVVDGVVTCGVALLTYAWLRRLHLQQSRLHALQQAQATTRRRLAEARLQTIQGRVEPGLLTDTLARIQQLQSIDVGRALQALDALIVYLRAAVPRGRVEVSTLAGEIGLVRAYLDVLRNSCSARITLEADLSPAAATAAFPAMILPCAIRHEVEGIVGRAVAEATLRIEAVLEQSHLRVRVSGATRDLPGCDDDRIEFLRARLASLYGERARFVRRRRVQGTRCEVETIIEVPQ